MTFKDDYKSRYVYKKNYNRGWQASARWSGDYRNGSPLERADARGEVDAWYDGYEDNAAGVAKWTTFHERREAEFDAFDQRVKDAHALLAYFRERDGDFRWLFHGARHFGNYDGPANEWFEAAWSLLKYFNPEFRNDEERAYRIRNGYTVTNDPATIWHIILRQAS